MTLEEKIDKLVLDLIYTGSMLPKGKTIGASMFTEHKQAILNLITEEVVKKHSGNYTNIIGGIMTTYNTKELDEIMDKIYDLAYDHLPERGIAIGTDRIKQAILDWHNKQTLELLDRLESQVRRADDCTEDTFVVKAIRIEAERNKLEAEL